MKHLKTAAAFGLSAALFCTGATPAARGADVPITVPDQPCTLARTLIEQSGRLAPQIRPLPNDRSFGAANGNQKLVVACGISPDETYTYSRLLSSLGVGLVVFKGDEPPDQVLQELSQRLKFSYRSAEDPQTFLLPGMGPNGEDLRVTVTAAADGGLPAAAAIQQPENIWDLYLLAKASDPELGRSHARFAASKADADIARSGLHPRVDGDLGISQILQTGNSTSSSAQSSVFGYNYDLNARMPLLHIPILHQIDAAKANIRGEEAGLSATRQNLIVRLGEAYFGILKARADERIAREEIDMLKQALEQAQAFLKAGTGDIIAVYEAQARLDSVVADLSRAESVVRLAEQKLSSIVGKPVSGIVDYIPKSPKGPEPEDLEWWLGTMEEKDPQIRQAREGLNEMQEQTKATKAERYPAVDALGGYNVSRGAAFAPSIETHTWHVGAFVTVPIYSGGETSARIRRAAANESERRYQLDAVREQRRENVKQSYFNLRYNVNLIKALEQKEASALVQLNAVRKGRSIGTRTAIDLLNAEQAYAMSQRDLKNALYDNVVRLIELKAAAGILAETDIAGSSQTATSPSEEL